MFTNTYQTLLTNEKDYKGEGNFPLEVSVINRNNLYQQLYTLLDASNGIATIDSNAIKNQQIEVQDGSKKYSALTVKRPKPL
ncbi:hypothetical protein LWM68_36685 [Niabella sp. W65]|nr:hypothetical protein [Niabella sp. W65]MCH7367800.1 hypothetical protein [Niabella sp. W65]ULT43273.1 hypothetical protein KRR40_07270 [Niabella sp. I65]